MRNTQTHHRRRIIFYVVLGIFINFMVANSSGWRAGALGFSGADNGYGDWTHFVEFEGGWESKGTTFGVSGWIDEHYTTDPPDLYSEDDDLSDQAGTLHSTMTGGTRIGWPFRCIQMSEVWHEETVFGPAIENERRSITNQKTDQTPTPYWYYKGIETKLNNSVLYRVPVQIRPIQFLINTLFYSIVMFGVLHLVVRYKRNRRNRRELCISCGYAVEDLEVCPECGSDHAA